MERMSIHIESLKFILGNIHNPERLDAHPWTRGLIIQDAVANMLELIHKSPGQQLVTTIGRLFLQMMPSTPPKRGKRLDTRWGEFGILAAQYFAPLIFGTPYPTSLRDAWGRIDQANLLFIYGQSGESLSEEEIKRYRLVGNELEIAPNSTISDWHRKGVQRLAEIILAREKHLSDTLPNPSAILQTIQDSAKYEDTLSALPEPDRPNKARGTSGSGMSNFRRFWILLPGLLVLVALLLGGSKALRIYTSGKKVLQDMSQLQSVMASSPGREEMEKVGLFLPTLRKDLVSLRHEVNSLLWLGPWLSWTPVYGGDLASARELLDLAKYIVLSTDEAYQAARPLLQAVGAGDNTLNPPEIAKRMAQAQPQFSEARRAFDQAIAVRGKIDIRRSSPDVRDLIVQDIDPFLALMDDGLSVATALPRLMGATSEGPKTYLLLVQNEDELRPTGGFICAVGNIVVKDGKVISLSIEDAGEQEDWSKPYPPAPWQLDKYMNSRVLILRDSNWFTNFPTAALNAEYLYAYTHSHSVDGVIAIDQQALVLILRAIEPLNVEGAQYPITADNVIAYMRAAQIPPPGARPSDWDDKAFIPKITSAVLDKLLTGRGIKWDALSTALFRALEERHLLVQFDDPVIAKVLVRHGWDGALRPGEGDFLMVVDTNIGFNKTNAVVETSLFYDVDMMNPLSPIGSLTIIHKNNASEKVPCIQWDEGLITEDVWYPINRCYWNYLRVYLLKWVELLEATPHAIPDSWMILNRGVPPRVDVLDEEVDGVQGFGTLVVVPGGQLVNTSFRFALPARVLSFESGNGQMTYRLKVQKQPGTLAIPIIIRVHLPISASLISIPTDAVVQENNVLFKTDLREDVEIEIVFNSP